MCVASATAVKTPAELFIHELIVAGSGASSKLSILPTPFNHVFGTKIHVIEGYKGTTEAVLAIGRGEVEGFAPPMGSSGPMNSFCAKENPFHLAGREAAIPERKDVPSIFDFAKTDAQCQLLRFVFLRFVSSSVGFGRPHMLPPSTSKERVDVMRRTFADAVHDPDLVAQAERLTFDDDLSSAARPGADGYQTLRNAARTGRDR
jgi:hypothetical protein